MHVISSLYCCDRGRYENTSLFCDCIWCVFGAYNFSNYSFFFFLIGCEGDIALLRETRCIRLITVEEETKIFNTEKTIV